MQEVNSNVKKIQEQDGKVIRLEQTVVCNAQISPQDLETSATTENVVTEAFRKISTGSTPTDLVQENIAALCQDVDNIDVKLKDVRSGSVLFEFQCFSLTAILDLIDYIYSPNFQKRLDAIAKAVGDVIGKTIYITGDGINRQSLECLITKLEKKEYQKVMQFKISGSHGLLRALEVFKKRKANTSLGKLPEIVEKPVAIQTSSDVEQTRGAVDKLDPPHRRDRSKLQTCAQIPIVEVPISQLANVLISENSSIKKQENVSLKHQTERKLRHGSDTGQRKLQTDSKQTFERESTTKRSELSRREKFYNQQMPYSSFETRFQLLHENQTIERQQRHYRSIVSLLPQGSYRTIRYPFYPCIDPSVQAYIRPQSQEVNQYSQSIDVQRSKPRPYPPTVCDLANYSFQLNPHSPDVGQYSHKQPNQSFHTDSIPQRPYSSDVGLYSTQKSEDQELIFKKHNNQLPANNESSSVKTYEQKSEIQQSDKCDSDQQEQNEISLKHKYDINIRTDDEINSFITGCAILSGERILAADHVNKKIKIVNKQTKSVEEELILHTWPFDLTVLPKGQIAVTLPEEKTILILSTNEEKMTNSDSWKIFWKPWGITSQQNEVYVVCCDDLLYHLSVIILDLSGVYLREIPLKDRSGLLGCGGHIAVSKDTEHLYITDYVRNSVLCITLQGLETSEYGHKEFQEPEGLLLLDDGCLLVSNNESGNIHYISADLKHGYILPGCTCKAISMCYNRHIKEVYFGCTNDPVIKVFSLRKGESS